MVDYFGRYLKERPLRRRMRISPEQRRAQLVRAAIQAIKTYGMETSVEQMAAEAGVTKPIIYRHFKDKAGLISAIEAEYEAELTKRLASALSSHPPTSPSNVKTLIEHSVRTYLEFVLEHLEIYRYLTRQTLQSEKIDTTEITRRLAQQVAGVIAQGLSGAGMDPAPAELWAHGIVGLVHLAADWWVDHQELSAEQATEMLSFLLWSGLKGVVAQAIEQSER